MEKNPTLESHCDKHVTAIEIEIKKVRESEVTLGGRGREGGRVADQCITALLSPARGAQGWRVEDEEVAGTGQHERPHSHSTSWLRETFVSTPGIPKSRSAAFAFHLLDEYQESFCFSVQAVC